MSDFAINEICATIIVIALIAFVAFVLWIIDKK